MIISVLAQVVLQFIYAVIALWYASILICDHRKFWPFVPVFLWGVLVCMRAALLYYGLSRTFLWEALDFELFLTYAFMLAAMIRLFAKRS